MKGSRRTATRAGSNAGADAAGGVGDRPSDGAALEEPAGDADADAGSDGPIVEP